MGKKTVTTWTCDRCGLSGTTENDASMGGISLPLLPRHWEYVGMNLLCGDCNHLWAKTIDRFMKRLLP